jgi:methionyl-tRNA synthetase
MEDNVTFGEFSKLDFRVGQVIKAEYIEGAATLMRLRVEFGSLGERTILSGIKKWYKPAELEGKNYIFVVNLKPRKIMGEQSYGMIIAAESDDQETCVLLIPDKEIAPGTKVH